jgi:hypothetical protein
MSENHEDEKRKAAIAKMLVAIPFMRHAMKQASQEGQAKIGILSVREGGGTVVAQFDAPEFFDELALIVGAPPQTEEDDLNAGARAIIDRLGLRGASGGEGDTHE